MKFMDYYYYTVYVRPFSITCRNYLFICFIFLLLVVYMWDLINVMSVLNLRELQMIYSIS